MSFNIKIIFLLLLISNSILLAKVGLIYSIHNELFYINNFPGGVFAPLESIRKETPTLYDLENKKNSNLDSIKIGLGKRDSFAGSSLDEETKEITNLKLFIQNNPDAKQEILKNFKNHIGKILVNKKNWHMILGLLDLKNKNDKGERSFKVIVGVSKKNKRSELISLYEDNKEIFLRLKKNIMTKLDKNINHINNIITKKITQYIKDNNLNISEDEVNSGISAEKIIDIINLTSNSTENINYLIYKAVSINCNFIKKHTIIPFSRFFYKQQQKTNEQDTRINKDQEILISHNKDYSDYANYSQNPVDYMRITNKLKPLIKDLSQNM